jgi:hypothetical protein
MGDGEFRAPLKNQKGETSMTNNTLMKSIRLAALAAVSLVPAMACSYSASSPAVGAGGGNVAIQIYTQPGCAWQVTSSAEWLQIFSSRSGSGSGTVYVYVAPKSGAARASYINVMVPNVYLNVNNCLGTRSGCGNGSQMAARSTVTEY